MQQGQPASLNLQQIVAGEDHGRDRDPNLTINVIGAKTDDVTFNACSISTWSGQTDYVSLYVDGGSPNNKNKTELNLTSYSLYIISSNVQASIVVKNSASLNVGSGVSTSNGTSRLNFSKENDRFLIENARNVSVKGNLEFTNKVKKLPVMAEISDQALIRNTNFSVEKTFLFGGLEEGYIRGNAFLQIINDEGVNAEFNVGYLIIQAPDAGNKTSFLVGHGANVKTSSPVIVQAQKEGATAQLLLGDTSSNEAFYNLNTPEVQLKGPGDAKVVFNNGHTGDSAQELRIPIVGSGSVEIQSGRTLFTVPTSYDGQTLIAEQGTLILPTLSSVGQSNIVDNGELFYTGVKGTLQDKISGTGAVSFNKNAHVAIQSQLPRPKG